MGFKKTIVIPSHAWEKIKDQTNVLSILAQHGIVFKVDDFEAQRLWISPPPNRPGNVPRRKKEVVLPQAAVDKLQNVFLPDGTSVLTWLNIVAGIQLPSPPFPPTEGIILDTFSGDSIDTNIWNVVKVLGSPSLSVSNGQLVYSADGSSLGNSIYMMSKKALDLSQGFELEHDIISMQGSNSFVSYSFLISPFNLIGGVSVDVVLAEGIVIGGSNMNIFVYIFPSMLLQLPAEWLGKYTIRYDVSTKKLIALLNNNVLGVYILHAHDLGSTEFLQVIQEPLHLFLICYSYGAATMVFDNFKLDSTYRG